MIRFEFGDYVVPVGLALLLGPLVLAALLYRSGAGRIADVFSCFVPHAVWFACVSTRLKATSFSNLVVEVPLVAVAILFVLIVRLAAPERLTAGRGLGLAVLAAVIVHAVTPPLPE